MHTIKIGILVYERCTASMVLGVLDILSLANFQSKLQNGPELFDIEIISSTGESVSSFSHFVIQPSSSIMADVHYDLIYVPGFMGDVDHVISAEASTCIAWLKRQFQQGTVLTAACNGNFLLAEAGVFAGRKATTHWSLIDTFRERYKNVELQPERILIDEGDTISAAGVTAYFNLALFLVERYGSKELSLTCAKVFLVDSGRKIQTPYQMYQISKKHGDEEIARVQEWLENNFNEPVTLEKLMDISHLSEKTLIRRFKKATGDTPLVFLQKLRVENAKRLLESKTISFNEITWEVGYNDVSYFHKLFKSETGLTPVEYRSRFSIV